MEGGTSVGTNALLTSTESSEILCRFGHHMVVKLNHYPSFKLSSYAYVQKAPRSLPHLSHSVFCLLGFYNYSVVSSQFSLSQTKKKTNRVGNSTVSKTLFISVAPTVLPTFKRGSLVFLGQQRDSLV